MKRISIITPSLNQGQFIEQTIKSVLSQRGDFYIDYIISDGGSTDNSIKIIKKYDKLLKTGQYPIKCKGVSYRWWSEKDKGQSHAINKGFKIAKGEILAWINSDDYYEPNTFNFIMRKFKENSNIDLIYGDGYIIDGMKKTKGIMKSDEGNFNEFLQKGYSICQPSAFFTKKIISKAGFLDKNLHYAMDYDLWLKILKNKNSLYIPKILSTFRIWENSKTTTNDKDFFKERKKIRKKLGGNIIDPKTIYKIRYKIKFLNIIQTKSPKFYQLFKKSFYFFLNKIKYKSITNKNENKRKNYE